MESVSGVPPVESGGERAAAFSSAVFQINAENGAKTFYVHADILSQNSEPFKSIVDGNWEESVNREINLEEWDADTVGRMIEYLYTRDYTWQKGGNFEPTPMGIPVWEESPRVESSFRAARPLTPLNGLMKCSPSYLSYDSWTSLFAGEDSKLEELLLMHAKVYALANYQAIEKLSELALGRLLLTLRKLKAAEYNPRQVGYVVELISYVYENTCLRYGEREPMRQAVTRFTALEITKLNSNREISNLMGTYGDFADDLLSDLTKRIKLAEVGGEIQHKYLAGVEIHTGPSEPSNCVREYQWGSPNINFGTKAESVWIVPYYTEDFDSACTSFKVVTYQKEGYDARFQIPMDIEPPRYPCLISVCDRDIRKKVSHVQLLRVSQTDQRDSIQRECGATGVTDDIVGSAHNEYLFLMWK